VQSVGVVVIVARRGVCETSNSANRPIRIEKPLIGRLNPENALDAFHSNPQSSQCFRPVVANY
jgi:hypothetical protein